MKYLFYTLILLLTNPVYAGPYTEVEEFSKWHRIDSFKEIIEAVPNNMYPAIVQGGALLGDGVEFRVLFNKKPSKTFRYHVAFGVYEKEFFKLNRQYLVEGFVLIHRQTVQLMGGLSYQAVWVKDAL